MKRNITLFITLVFSLLHNYIQSGYESTEKEEKISRMNSGDEAYLTFPQEEIARTENVNDAYFTENQEELARIGNIDDARITSAAKRSSQG